MLLPDRSIDIHHFLLSRFKAIAEDDTPAAVGEALPAQGDLLPSTHFDLAHINQKHFLKKSAADVRSTYKLRTEQLSAAPGEYVDVFHE